MFMYVYVYAHTYISQGFSSAAGPMVVKTMGALENAAGKVKGWTVGGREER